MIGKRIKLVALTGNRNKANEYRTIIQALRPMVELEGIDPGIEEQRKGSFRKTAEGKLEDSMVALVGNGHELDSSKIYFAEDAGIEISALEGYPGVKSAAELKRIGLKGILKLMEGKKDRSARFVAAIAFWKQGDIQVVEGIVDGRIILEIRGPRTFGYDPIFVPEGYSKTFAEDPETKLGISHRRRAVEKMLEAI